MQGPHKFCIVYILDYQILKGERSMLQNRRESGLLCANKAYKILCITEENKAQKDSSGKNKD